MKGYKLTVESGKLKVIYMVQKIAPYLCQWKIESGKWKIVLNNFQLSIFNLEEMVGCNFLHLSPNHVWRITREKTKK